MKRRTTGTKCEICGKEIRPHISSLRVGEEAERIKIKGGAVHYVHTDCYRKQLKKNKYHRED